MTATERFTRHAARYTEASLVKKTGGIGHGSPSTYAPTISTIIKTQLRREKDKDGVKRAFRVLKLKNDTIEKITERKIRAQKNQNYFLPISAWCD
jgi:DNA topoisomerase-1